MKTFLVLQHVASFRIDWRSLYQPEAYRLILIVSSPNYERLLATQQQQYFDRVIRTDDFSLEHLTAVSSQTLDELGVTDRDSVRVVTHDEYSLDVAARLREALGVAGARPLELRSFVNKVEMKRALAGKGIRVPQHLAWEPTSYQRDPGGYVAHAAATLGFPIFAKPVDESGSVGTARLETRADLDAWCAAHLDDVGYELDEWISGTLFHCDSIIQDGRIRYTHVCEYAHPCYDYLSGKICASITLPRESETFQELAAFTESVLMAIGPMPRDTVTHLEVFRTAQGELVFLEIAARAPAAMMPFVYERHLGVNIEEAHFRLHMGILDDLTIADGPYGAWAYFPHRTGTVTALHQPQLASPHEITWKIKVGDRFNDPENIRDTACIVLLWNDDYATLRRDFAALDTFQAFSVSQADASVEPLLAEAAVHA